MVQDTVRFTKTQQRFVERYTDMLAQENPDQIGPGKQFANKRALTEWLLDHNPHKEWLGYICGKQEKGTLVTGRELTVPAGFEFHELRREVKCVVTPEALNRAIARVAAPPALAMALAPMPEAMPAALAAPASAEMTVVNPHESLRRASPAAGGKFVTPETTHFALEQYARVGGNPQFSRAWYALEDVAARIPVLFAKHSGQVGGDHLIEGKRGMFQENTESRRDDSARDKDSQGGGRQRGFIAGYTEFTVVEDKGVKYVQPADNKKARLPLTEFLKDEKGNLTGDPATIPVGTMIRFDKGINETPHGGDMVISPTLWMPSLTGEPTRHMPFDAEQRRWGLTQSHAVLSWEDFAGRDTMFRDTQAKTSSPFETADRINSSAVADSVRRDFTNAMRAFDAAKTPEEKAKHAEIALVAWRDLGDNKLIARVDAKREQLNAGEAGLKDYFARAGVDVAALEPKVKVAPRLPVRFMDQATLESLQDYSPTNPQYMGIRAGEVMPTSGAMQAQAYAGQNYAELHIAKGYGRERSEAEMISDSRAAWSAIVAKPDAVKAIGRGMRTNSELATEFGEALADMPRNPKLYGFQTEQQAKDYVVQFTGLDKRTQDQVLKDGDTFNFFFGRDDNHNMQDPRKFGAAASAVIEAKPELFRDAMDRITRPLAGSKTDGRRGGLGMLRAMAAERGTKEGEMGPIYSAVAATGIANEASVRQTVMDAGIYAERWASGRSVNGFQRLDNLYVAAEYGALAAAGQKVMVATDAEIQNGTAKARADAMGGTVKVFNTGVFDGQKAFEAAKAGDNAALSRELFQSPDAQKIGSTGLAVQGLHARPVLGRDAVMATMLRDPQSLDGAIRALHSLDRSTKVSRYNALADALEDTQEAIVKFNKTGDKKQLEKAGLRYADFFSDMEKNAKNNGGAWRDNAWGAFINAAANDPKASAALMDTMARDATMRDALLKGTPDALVASDGVRGTNRGKLGKGNQLPDNIRGDAVYKPQFITVSEKGFHEGVDVNRLLAASGIAAPAGGTTNVSAAATAAAIAAADGLKASGVKGDSLSTAAVLGVNKTVVLGAAGSDPVAGLAVILAKSNVQVPAAVKAEALKGIPAAELAKLSAAETSALVSTNIAKNLIATGQVTVTSAGQLAAGTVTSSGTQTDSLATGGHMAAAPGTAKWWWMVGAYLATRGGTDPEVPRGNLPVCDTACAVDRSGASTPGIINPPRPTPFIRPGSVDLTTLPNAPSPAMIAPTPVGTIAAAPAAPSAALPAGEVIVGTAPTVVVAPVAPTVIAAPAAAPIAAAAPVVTPITPVATGVGVVVPATPPVPAPAVVGRGFVRPTGG